MMLRVDCAALGCRDDVHFVESLLTDAAVFVLPGACFGMPGFVRIVTTPPRDKLEEAVRRMADFCSARSAEGK